MGVDDMFWGECECESEERILGTPTMKGWTEEKPLKETYGGGDGGWRCGIQEKKRSSFYDIHKIQVISNLLI